MDNVRVVKSGKLYKHFKGGLYKVVGVAVHTETNEELVIYHKEGNEFQMFVRPVNMFLDEISYDGKMIKRFEEIQ
jgi:hypothetical protein